MAFYAPGRMEIACVKPGHWRVEGYDVERVSVKPPRWRITRRRTDEPDEIFGFASSLTEACYDIFDRY